MGMRVPAAKILSLVPGEFGAKATDRRNWRQGQSGSLFGVTMTPEPVVMLACGTAPASLPLLFCL